MHSNEELVVGRYARYSAYISIALAAVGLIGNGLCVRMMVNQRLKVFSCSVFLLGLCISDSVVLVCEVLDDIAEVIPNYTAYDILVGKSSWRCRFGTFFYESSRIVSAWLVVAMTAELCMVAVRPDRNHLIYQRKRAVYVTLAVTLVGVAGCFPFLVISAPPAEGVSGLCTSKYSVFYAVYTWFVLRAATQVGIPMLFVIGCNTASILLLPKKGHIKYMSRGPLSGGGALDMQDQEGTGHEKKSFQAKMVILGVSIVYVVAVLPSGAIQTMFAVESFKETFTLLPKQDWFCAYYIAQVILLLAYSSKFYIVMLLGPEFRKALGMKLSTLQQAGGRPMNLNYVSNGTIPHGDHGLTYGMADF